MLTLKPEVMMLKNIFDYILKQSFETNNMSSLLKDAWEKYQTKWHLF